MLNRLTGGPIEKIFLKIAVIKDGSDSPPYEPVHGKHDQVKYYNDRQVAQ